jgi:uncharacterized protein
MSEKLPELIDPVYCAQHHKAYAGQVKQARFPRLADQLVQADDWVEVAIKFYPCPGVKAYGFDLRVKTCLRLQCQRSLQPFGFPVDVALSGAFVESMALAESLPEETAVFELPEDKVALNALVEDELLLQIPLSPVDTSASLPDYEPAVPEWGASESDVHDEKSDNPFQALQGLKSQND